LRRTNELANYLNELIKNVHFRKAALGLVDIVGQAGVEVDGIGIAIEKGFQDGGRLLEKKESKFSHCQLFKAWRVAKLFFRNLTSEKIHKGMAAYIQGLSFFMLYVQNFI